MITREQAEQALASIRQQFKVYIDAGEPEPVPFEWAYRAKGGGVDEELTLLGREFKEDYVARTPAAQEWPKGVYAEPYFSYVLTLYGE